MTSLIFLSEQDLGVEIYAVDGNLTLDSIQIIIIEETIYWQNTYTVYEAGMLPNPSSQRRLTMGNNTF